jgi:hypothetical protein
MSKKRMLLLGVVVLLVGTATGIYSMIYFGPEPPPALHSTAGPEGAVALLVSQIHQGQDLTLPEPKPLPNYVQKSIDWLVQAQAANGGWGAGSHSRQGEMDPHAVQVDPATTALAGMVLIRIGNTLDQGAQKESLRKALEFLLQAVGQTPDNSANITTLHGTQAQQKLGQNIDVAMTSQFLSRVLPLTATHTETEKKVKDALEKCVRIIENAQQADGSWSTSGWAPVLNSAMASNALELAQANGVAVDTLKIAASERYQQSNIDEDGAAKTERSAGIALYSVSSTQRANSKLRNKADKYLSDDFRPAAGQPAPKKDQVQQELEKKGVSKEEAARMADGYVAYEAGAGQMRRDDVLSGFGNNGGEEFLSYMMTSESFVSGADQRWNDWHVKMASLFEKIQNDNGSWSGHHCITSPVFCTAAVIMTLTADRDPLLALASK